MKRAHEQAFASEICFIDSSGSCDQTSTVATFVIGVHKTGGIPLACLLHTAQTEMNYHLAFKILKTQYPAGFGGSGAPKTFMTDDSSAERNALKSVFPQTSLILCTFHVCQAVWRWLWDGKNKVDIKDRKKLMMEFRSILYAQTEEDSKEFFRSLCVGCKYNNFVNYVSNLWGRKNEWCHFYR